MAFIDVGDNNQIITNVDKVTTSTYAYADTMNAYFRIFLENDVYLNKVVQQIQTAISSGAIGDGALGKPVFIGKTWPDRASGRAAFLFETQNVDIPDDDPTAEDEVVTVLLNLTNDTYDGWYANRNISNNSTTVVEGSNYIENMKTEGDPEAENADIIGNIDQA